MKWCKHPGCRRPAIVYKRDGITVVACKEHFKVLVDYLKEHLREEVKETR